MSTSTHSSPDVVPHGHGHVQKASALTLAVGAVGVVFGDIGTSPLYAFRETFASHHGVPGLIPDAEHIHGVLSLVFWSMMMVVTVKYVFTIMRADNKGEGGSLALLALIRRVSDKGKWTAPLILLGVFATALFYGDSMITPAISVLSATEGMKYIVPGFEPWIVPTAVAILFGLFAIQSRGTDRVGKLFGPIMLGYFAMLATLGVMHLSANPAIILETINPANALRFFVSDGFAAFVALGSVVLAVTGAEALYADMGHFGRKPIGLSWLTFVFPALMLNYMGQGAMILSASSPAAAAALVKDPFFLMIPDLVRVPVIILALLATIIASQAVISGAFSLTQQAIQLGFMPRMEIRHTSAAAAGQIYIPAINWGLMVMVILLVLFFQSSSNLAAAYGIAVTGAMFIDTLLLAAVLFSLWRWPVWKALPLVAV
ncbi:MAG: KUP/HAK/KT family potassium transporter, partial [Sphingomonadales bacterium]|nr:KUP/HAK/KT family potassium transporter [Sphingomonadales bacterium]